MEKLTELILYNWRIKRIAAGILANPIINANPLYNFFYRKTMEKKMRKGEAELPEVYMEGTNACDAHCTICPHKSMKYPVGVMSRGLSQRITDEYSVYGKKNFLIMGFGEPLLDPWFTRRLRYASVKKVKHIRLITNGMYLDQMKTNAILLSSAEELAFSFDAATKETYKKIRPGLDFDRVKHNIISFIKAKKEGGFTLPKIMLDFVVSPLNEHELKPYLREWEGKVDRVCISLKHNWAGRVKGGQPSPKKEPCRFLWRTLQIRYNGDAVPCCLDYEHELVLGNVKKETLLDIWHGDKINHLRRLHKEGRFDEIPLCKSCNRNTHYKQPWWIS